MGFLDKTAKICLIFIAAVVAAGLLAPWLAPNLPNETVIISNVIHKFASPSWDYPFGTDHLGRCILSRILYGIQSTILLSLVTMTATVALGAFIGLVSGYLRGIVDEVFMRICDVMLSFPSQVMILAVVGMLGVGLTNVIIANIIIKWAWYARMIRSSVVRFAGKNYIAFAQVTGSGSAYIIRRHLLPLTSAEIIIFSSLDTGWVILNISTLSFLGLGVQAPTAEWGAMLSDAKNVLSTHPAQMLAPGLAILAVVGAFNMLGDSLRDALALKERHDEQTA